MRQHWWKGLACLLLCYTFIAGFLLRVPDLPILEQSIRNLYFHVAMWMVMMLCFLFSLIYALCYLRTPLTIYDRYSYVFARLGLLTGCLGLITGALWARHTWGAYWSNDPKQIGAVIGLLMYWAYMMLRSSVTDTQRIPRIAAIYNIFSFAMLFPTLWILPRMVDSLHPGGMGNPALNTDDIDQNMRMVFYPSVLGWTLTAVWIAQLEVRLWQLKEKPH